MARALRAYPPPVIQQAPPHGPTAVDRLRKAITDAGPDAITCTVPVVVVAGVLEALGLSEQGRRLAEHDARAARETQRWASEKADLAREALAQAEARHRTAMKRMAKQTTEGA